MSISVCMISKNEEKNIERCLKSIQSIADEIILVDTGSTDKTIEIAKKYGAKVFYHEWNKDFSEVRNKSIEFATKDWILFLDCDEELHPEDINQLKSTLDNNPMYEGFYMRVVNIVENRSIGDAIVFRVFKNNPKYRFIGKMHEQIIGSIEKNTKNPLGSTQIRILHYGYDPKVSDPMDKSNRNLEILLGYKEEHKDGYYYYSIGNEYTRIGDFNKAMDSYNKALKISVLKSNNIPIYYAYLMSSIIKILHANQMFYEELKYINSFKNTFSDFRDIYFYECLVYIAQSKLTLAKESLMKFINCKSTSYSYPVTNFESDYDINSILEQLNNASRNIKGNLLSTIIIAPYDNPTIIETIKSINEISCQVILITPTNSNLNRDKIKNYGGIIVEVSCENINEYYSNAFKVCIGEYVLIMEMGEIMSFESQKALINLLDNTTEGPHGYFVYLADKTMKINSKSLRLFKNTNKLHDINYINYFMDNNIVKDSNVIVYKYFDTNYNCDINPILDRKIENTDRKEYINSISVCIIAKNEEKNISKCLSSVAHIADEIILVDTGSDDNTINIARQYTSKIYYHEFEDDFSKARNIALENATKNWILHLDCDEELDYVDGLKLKDILKNINFEGYCLDLINVIEGEKNLSLPSLRVFKNRKEHRYEGKIHEQIQNSIKKYSGENTIQVTDVKLYHYGYDSNLNDIDKKIKRNLKILESYPEEEKSGFYYYNLGNEYKRQESLEQAIDCYMKAITMDDYIGYKLYLPIYIVSSFYALGNYKKGIEYGDKFLKEYHTYKDLYFITSVCYYKLGNKKKCEEYLNKYIEHSIFDYGYPKFNFTTSNNIDELLNILSNY